MLSSLRYYIKLILEKENKKKKELLTEPDKVTSKDDQDRDDEASVVANVAGVTTPLGTGPTYPRGKRKSKKRKAPAGGVDWYKSK